MKKLPIYKKFMNSTISKNFYNVSKISKGWKEIRLKYIISISDKKSLDFNNEKNLSLTKSGVVIKDIENNKGQIAESYEKYISVKKNQICMNPMDLLSGWVDISPYDGIISPAYYTLILNSEFNTKFINYFLQSNYFRETFFTLGKGVASHDNFGRWVLTPDELKNVVLFFPNIENQKIISLYLDDKINLIKLLIEKLNSKKILIKEAIKNYFYEINVKSKKLINFNNDWFQTTPEDWEIVKFKQIFEPSNIIKNSQKERLLSVTQDRGVVFRDEQSRGVVNPTSNTSSYKLVHPGDVIISLRSADGGFETSDIKGLVSPAYIVLKPKVRLDRNFYRLLLTSKNFVIEIGRYIKGIRDGKNIYFDDIKDIKIPYLPENKWNKNQETIEEIHKDFFNIFKKIDKKVVLLDEYRKSLLSSLIAGKVDIAETML